MKTILTVFLFIYVFACKTNEAQEGPDIILYKVAMFAYKADTLESTLPPGYQYPLKFYFELGATKGHEIKVNTPDSIFSRSKPSHFFYSVLDGDTLELIQAYAGNLLKPENKSKFTLCVTFDDLKSEYDSTKYINYRMYMEDVVNRSEIYYLNERIEKKDIEVMYLDPDETYVN